MILYTLAGKTVYELPHRRTNDILGYAITHNNKLELVDWRCGAIVNNVSVDSILDFVNYAFVSSDGSILIGLGYTEMAVFHLYAFLLENFLIQHCQ